MYRSSINLNEEAIANINGEDLKFKHLVIDAEDDGSLSLWMTDKDGHELNVRITIPANSVGDLFDELTELQPYATGTIKGKHPLVQHPVDQITDQSTLRLLNNSTERPL